MREILGLLFAMLTAFQLCGQTLPAERSTDWTLAGFKGNRNVDFAIIDFVAHGGNTDGETPNDGVYQSILEDLNGDPAIIYFQPGTFFFENTINLRSNLILRGASADETIFHCDLGGSGDLISARGSTTGIVRPLSAAPLKDDYFIVVEDVSNIEAGDYIQLIEDDDSLITSDWALRTTGQIVVVESVSGDVINLRSPLRRSYQLSKNVRIVKLEPLVNVGIENIKVIRQDATESQTSNIGFEIVADSWIDCVESYNSNFAHINLRKCTNLDVTGCFMKDAFAYGGGGQGYGTVLQSTTGECLVTDNRFKHLRHSMILQSGANGNVISYNYSEDPYWTDVLPLPANSAGDLVLHGNYVYLNLFEGNDVAHMVIDASHGFNGPYNTLFRNRAHLYGIFMNNNPASNHQNIIGNEITNSNIIMGYYVVSGSGHFEYANNLRGQIIPPGTTNPPANSLYLQEAPEYYQANNSWPPIGLPNPINSHDPLAEIIFDGGYLTTCSADIILGIEDVVSTYPSISVYPVPASGYLKIIQNDSSDPIEKVEIYSLNGMLVYTAKNINDLSIGNLTNGPYLIKVLFRDGMQAFKKIIVAKY